MSKIISIGTSTPAYKHAQEDILQFMLKVYATDAGSARKIRFLYHQSGISYRYSAIQDYSRQPADWDFYPSTEDLEPFPGLEKRMDWYKKEAASLSATAIQHCLKGQLPVKEVTHLITVSCTGMSAPGLDLELIEMLDLSRNTCRSSVNFMGCYAAIHAMKMADAICKTDHLAKVLIVCTELCTLHFQKQFSPDAIASSLLFGDGAAALLICPDNDQRKGLRIEGFYSEIIPQGKEAMSWTISSSGFLMTLSGYVPELIETDFEPFFHRALAHYHSPKSSIRHWCIHPGGKRILQSIQKSASLETGDLKESYEVLREYGNMSSPTLLFVLDKIMRGLKEQDPQNKIFGAAFGPGLTMETFIASPDA